MLATFMVTNNADSGVGSLRDAVAMANSQAGADTINFDASLSGDTILLGGTQIEITEALTIDATALAQKVIVDANQQSRIFDITATSDDFTLAGLKLTGGRTSANVEPGGAVRSATSGSLTVDQSTVSTNSTTGGRSYGGGISAE